MNWRRARQGLYAHVETNLRGEFPESGPSLTIGRVLVAASVTTTLCSFAVECDPGVGLVVGRRSSSAPAAAKTAANDVLRRGRPT